MYTIRELCMKSGLSRTALLYYESIGLLVAEARSESNYRLYSDISVARLKRICTYRDAGVSLEEIVQILDYESDVEREVLERTLLLLNEKANEIKKSQARIAALLHQEAVPTYPFAGIDLKAVLDSLAPLGIDESVLLVFHEALEHNSPEGHRSFLSLCGFSQDDINRILASMRKDDEGGDYDSAKKDDR